MLLTELVSDELVSAFDSLESLISSVSSVSSSPMDSSWGFPGFSFLGDVATREDFLALGWVGGAGGSINCLFPSAS